MERAIFEALWAKDKTVNEDIVFVRNTGYTETYFFDDVEVLVDDPMNLHINGTYSCRTKALTINFGVVGVGAIHRYDLGGNRHRDAGRYHQHSIVYASDVRQNLPEATRRDDLRDLPSEEAWNVICREAKIYHAGTWFRPEELCT